MPKSSDGIGPRTIVVLCLLLTLPTYALSRLATSVGDWRVLAGAPLAMSLFTYFSYRSDKRRAETGAWRIPESTLHGCELLGGWPGAFLAQRKFRHKIAKGSYQVVFWAIVLLHQWIAFDSLFGWKYTSEAWRFLRAQVG